MDCIWYRYIIKNDYCCDHNYKFRNVTNRIRSILKTKFKVHLPAPRWQTSPDESHCWTPGWPVTRATPPAPAAGWWTHRAARCSPEGGTAPARPPENQSPTGSSVRGHLPWSSARLASLRLKHRDHWCQWGPCNENRTDCVPPYLIRCRVAAFFTAIVWLDTTSI